MPTVDLAACQVFVTMDDYASPAAFEAMLARVGDKLERARPATEGERPPCLAVFPENIGTFLPLAGRLDLVRGLATTDQAMQKIALRAWAKLLRSTARYRPRSTATALLVALSDEIFATYRAAFSLFARRHHAWVVAGSVLLPRNAFGDLAERFAPAGARVYNTSLTFDPEGRIVAATRKVNLVPGLEDTLGLTPGRPADLLPVDAPFGRFGSLICYDGFHEPHTSKEPGFCRLVGHYDDLGCSVIAQPAANPWPWDARWVFAEPGETQLRRDQWQNEGLTAELSDADLHAVRYGVTAHLLGDLFDNHFDGRSHILERRGHEVVVLAEAASSHASLESEEVVVHRVTLEH